MPNFKINNVTKEISTNNITLFGTSKAGKTHLKWLGVMKSIGSAPQPIYKWENTEMQACWERDLVTMRREYVSYNNGSTWQSTGKWEPWYVVEYNSDSCRL